MCVLARDEWRKNNDAYTGLCGLFCRIIRREGFVETDDQKLNAKMLVFMNTDIMASLSLISSPSLYVLLIAIQRRCFGGTGAKKKFAIVSFKTS